MIHDLLIHDLRHALRKLRRSPGFALTAILTLALGIGATTAVFSVMNAVLLRSLPVPDPQQLVYLGVPDGQPDGASNTGNSDSSFSEPAFEALRQNPRAFRDVIAFAPLSIDKVAVRFGSAAEAVEGDMVSGNFFSGLGVQLQRGRAFDLADERQHTQVAVISDAYWTRRFARDPAVLGQTLYIKGVPFTITGVASKHFQGVEPGASTDLWIPLQNRPELGPWGTPADANTLYGSPSWWCLRLIARLAPGVTAQQALAAVTPSYQAAAYTGIGKPKPGQPLSKLSSTPARGLGDQAGSYRTPITILASLVLLVLVIACSNVAMLLVARNTARTREFSVRLALGAATHHLFRQLLIESALLVATGAGLGWLLAYPATSAMAAWSGIEISLAPDRFVLLFTLIVSAAVAFCFSMAPLRLAARVPVTVALKAGAATSHQTSTGRAMGNIVMSAQVAMCVALLMAAGLLLRTLHNYATTNLGMRTQGLLVFGITPQKTASKDQVFAFYTELIRRIDAAPGVVSATLAENRPGSGWSDNDNAVVDGVAHSFAEAPLRSNSVGPDFFHTLGVPILEGRDISTADTASSERVAVVNETFVKRLFPKSDPLGHTLGSKKIARTIIGVVQDSKYTSVDEKSQPMAYYAYTQSNSGGMHVEVRTEGDPLALLPSLTAIVRALDPNVPLEKPMTQQAVFDASYNTQRLFSALAGFFGLLAALLVATGLYGTLAFRVHRRTPEIGLRMALGADRKRILGQVLRESLVIALFGIAAGIPMALLTSHFMQSMLYGVPVHDRVSWIASIAIVVVIATLASLLPARRAASIDPITALRTE